ncbi:MAG: glycosyltransferase, partial [Phycisphaerales bacterium]
MIDPRQPDYARTPVHPERPGYGYGPRGADGRAAPSVGLAEPRPTPPPHAGVGSVDAGRVPAVSIITPYYNTGPIFHETAASIFNQSFQDWEWIIVNDGTPDPEARGVLDDYRQRDPRVRVLDLPENRGLSAARNAGYAAARSDLVMQIDSDDMAEPTFLEKCVWFLRTNPQWGFVCGWTVGFGHENYLWGRGFHNIDAFLHENLVTPTSVVRKSVWQAAGGYDEANRKGLEDWDFWLRCASAGHWGTCIPEFLDWYRRRPNHNSSWGNWDRGPNQERFTAELKAKYADLYGRGLPRPKPTWPTAMAPLPAEAPVANPLAKTKPRLMMIVPWLRFGGADKFNLDLIEQLTKRGWEVSVATTLEGDQSWLAQYARLTPDVFVTERFLRPPDRVVFLRYLIESRRPDVVMVTNSELGYHVLPYLRSCCPEPAYVDLTHIEEEGWKTGGYPRYAAATQDMLDLNIVVSEHLKRWMVDRGGEGERIEVCHINVDPSIWASDAGERARVREELAIPADATVLLYPARLCAQ